jgi:hypothetical protein
MLRTTSHTQLHFRWHILGAQQQNTYEFQNLDNFHGTGALNLIKYPEWDTILLDMLQRPPDVVIVSAKRRGRGHGGWSKNNPYLEEVGVRVCLEPFPLCCLCPKVAIEECYSAGRPLVAICFCTTMTHMLTPTINFCGMCLAPSGEKHKQNKHELQ